VKAIPETEIHGHIVQSDFTATTDHLLVDKNDFNAPFGYQFADDKRMWYQRTPDDYANLNTGWEGVSIPFEAEIVTTNEKGEITHFYKEDATSQFSKKYDTGHEYWLRKFESLGQTTDAQTNETMLAATFKAPVKVSAVTKKDDNIFLWDYYYSYNQSKDQNEDVYKSYDDEDYKKTEYYKYERSYPGYPRLTKATPYIIGFPGERYYEFDLSGEFEAKTALVTPAKLTAQIITFASAAGATIGVSDTELATALTTATADGYTFVPNYAGKTLTSAAYILNTNDDVVDNRGNSYQVVASDAITVPFRPYFIGTSSAREGTRSIGQVVNTIIFSDEQTQLEGEDETPKDKEIGGTLNIYAKRKKIVVSSTLSYTADLRVVTPAGITVSTFSVKPGETVEVRADFSGMYIVHTLDGQYMKKVAIKRE
jgi:hypothetical protein